MATSPNYGWLEPDNTDLVKNGALAIRTLGDAIDTTMATMTPKSIVDAKGDLIAASANDTPARLAVGANGETLVADSSTSTGLRYQGNFAAGKNAIINGDFGIWQRGTTFTNATVNTFTADRWFFGGSGNNTGSISRQTFTPGTAPVAGYEGKYFFRFDQTTTGITPAIIYRIEDVQTFAGQTVTLSFWVKTSSAITGGIVNAYVEQFFGSGGSANVATQILNTTNTTTGWTRITASVAVPSIAGKTIGTSSYLQLTIYPKAATVLTMDLWGFQLEAGSVATAFQTATGTIQGELAACQRYYWRYVSTGVVRMSLGYATSADAAVSTIPYPVQMRTAPTALEQSGTATDYNIHTAAGAQVCSAVPTFLTSTNNAGTVTLTATGLLTAGQGLGVRSVNTNAFFGWSAEL